jgi:hypothetical protein
MTGFNLGTAHNEQFHQIEPLLANGICRSPILRLLCLVRRDQFDKTVEPGLD